MATKTVKATGKVTGQVLAEFEGLTITGLVKRAKRSGKDRLWIQIRQNGAVKRWRVSANLSYARSTDIQFEDEPGS